MASKGKTWKLRPGNLDLENSLSETFGISKYTARLLVNRGLDSIEKVKSFLNPDIQELHDPYLLPDMKEAVDRIELAIENGEPILIYGDYDVDGITGVSLLITYLRYMGARVAYHIPKRLDEGYGLNFEAIQKAYDKGFKLIVTVDCGISAHEEVEKAKLLGLDVIITDHHEPSLMMPVCVAVVNPKLSGSNYPFQFLAGVGVAFKLCQALWENRNKPSGVLEPMNYIELVAFGTVADVVPLLGENRVIVKYGLEKMNRSAIPGMRALIDVSGKSGKEITSGTISFVFAPKVNACGRLGDPGLGVKLLLSRDFQEVSEIALKLNEENIRRQKIEAEILKDAMKMLKEFDSTDTKGIVLASKAWHTGVIGIAASKIAELTNKPTFLISIDSEGVGKGSGRSVSGFDLYSALNESSDLLIKYGGHSQAAGLSINASDIDAFRCRFNEIASNVLS